MAAPSLAGRSSRVIVVDVVDVDTSEISWANLSAWARDDPNCGYWLGRWASEIAQKATMKTAHRRTGHLQDAWTWEVRHPATIGYYAIIGNADFKAHWYEFGTHNPNRYGYIVPAGHMLRDAIKEMGFDVYDFEAGTANGWVT